VTFSEVKIYMPERDKWVTITTEPKTLDILWLCEHNESEIIGIGAAYSMNYTIIRLTITGVTAVLKDTGETIILYLPSGEIELNYLFEIKSGGLIIITVHFDLEQSIRLTDEGCYEFVPVIECITEENHLFEMSINPASLCVVPGETATYTITITNTGTVEDTYELTLITNINSSWVNLYVKSVTVIPGSSAYIILEIAVPGYLALMENATYSFNIQVRYTYEGCDSANISLGQSDRGVLTVIATKESKTRHLIIETEELIATLNGMDIPNGLKNSLRVKLEGALEKLNTALDDILNGNENHANNMLNCAESKINAFINEVEAQRGKKISKEDADILTNVAQTIILHIDDTTATPL
jgi:uncharacterized repeat protein (TIGR01451 family)